jgi:ribosomal protein L11 methyltransferase
MNPLYRNELHQELKQIRFAGKELVLSSGEGWGNGSHETTQLCLQALALFAPQRKNNWRMLDFGMGSGLLAIGGAKLGAQVEGIEIDEAGIRHGKENVHLNDVGNQVRISRTLDGIDGPFDLIVANILRPILLEFASELSCRLGSTGTLILSGLVATDLPEVSVRYSALLKSRGPEIYCKGDWRVLVWNRDCL